MNYEEVYHKKLYHGTTSNVSQMILENGYIVREPRKTDNYWLGHGVYFFDSYDKADWWSRAKVKSIKKSIRCGKKKAIRAIVLRSVIETYRKKVLDLDTENDLEIFLIYAEKSFEFFLSDMHCSLKIESDDDQRRLRCLVCDAIKEEFGYDIITYSFDKKAPRYGKVPGSLKTLKGLGLAYREKQYCISRECVGKVIKDTEIFVPKLAGGEII